MLIPLILSIVLATPSYSWLPKIFWTFWDQPFGSTQEDYFLQSFIFNFHNKLESQGWDIRHLNNNNMWDWMGAIESFRQIYEREAINSEPSAKRSDYVRLALLKQYGGVYADVTTILTRGLDWVFQLEKIKQIQNRFDTEPEVFLIYNSEHGSKQKYFDQNTQKQYLIFPTYEDFFIASKPGSKFISDWLNFTLQTKLLSWQKYKNVKKSLIIDIANQQNIYKGGFNTYGEAYYDTMIAAQVVLQRKQRELDKSWNKDIGSGRQLAVKYYGTWVMGSSVSAFKADLNGGVQYFMHMSQEELKQKKLDIPYFSKIFRHQYFYLKQRLFTFEGNQTCTSENYIRQSSIIYIHLFKDYPVIFYKNCVLNQIHRPSEFHEKKIRNTEERELKALKQRYNYYLRQGQRIYIQYETKILDTKQIGNQKLQQREGPHVNSTIFGFYWLTPIQIFTILVIIIGLVHKLFKKFELSANYVEEAHQKVQTSKKLDLA